MLEEGASVALVPPRTDLPRHVTVNYVREIDESSYELGFDEVVDEAQAHGLVGCHCLIERASIDESLYENEPASWDGWTVVDGEGNVIGAVNDVIRNPGQALLEVNRLSGKPVYIPAVDEIICAVDVEERSITVNLPDGLLDL
jgi:16S rRNA processing protein RimM